MYNDVLLYYMIFIRSTCADMVPWQITQTQTLLHLHELQGAAAAGAFHTMNTVAGQFG